MTLEKSKDKTTIQKVAFVAMPFGIKSTDVLEGKGPAKVNFDALWGCD